MNRTEWLNRLELLHVRTRDQLPLSPEEEGWYRQARASLLETAVAVQNRMLATGDRARGSIRLVRAVQVLLEARGWSQQAMTADLGGGGFAVLLDAPPPQDDWIRATLVLPREGAVVSTVSVANVSAASGLVRVAFTFAEPSSAVRPRIEAFMLDGILEQLVFWDDVLERLSF